jgi:alpha-1,2-mannosyltransferase
MTARRHSWAMRMERMMMSSRMAANPIKKPDIWTRCPLVGVGQYSVQECCRGASQSPDPPFVPGGFDSDGVVSGGGAVKLHPARHGNTTMMETLRDGRWLTPSRLRIYGLTLIAFYIAIFVTVFATAHGPIDATGKPIGTDFSQVWVAGRSVLAGDPQAPFDPQRHELAQHAVFGPSDSFYGWHYPPYFLAIAAVAALMPYLLALLVWQGTTLVFYAVTLRRIVPGTTALICALAFPAVYVNLGHGHNGFLTAGLMGSALLCLPRREFLAGALFALVAYKPQFGMVVPVALVAGGYWRAIAAAAATLAVMTLASVAAFGWGTWVAFERSLTFTRSVVLEQGNTGWEKIQSVFSAVRMWGGSVAAAYAVQAAVTVLVLGAVFWLWRRRGDLRLRGAALLAAALLTTPYCLDYDMMLLGPAIAFAASYMLERGFVPWEKTALAGIWVTPLFARIVAQHVFLPLGLISIAGLFLIVCRRDEGRKDVLF